MSDKNTLRHWLRPGADIIGPHIESFLRNTGGPAHIEIPGRDTSRCRVLVTLLHGNETSGIKALHELLHRETRPAVTMHCFILATRAALLEPLFTHRQVPGQPDLNRCFRAPGEADPVSRSHEFHLAQTVWERIQALQPEAVVDMHNTSGEGPSFAVTTTLASRHEPIVSLFTQRLIVTDLKLGALMEQDSAQLPVVTVECGGAFEETADRIALEGLERYFTNNDIRRCPPTDWPLDVYRHPMRMEITHSIRLAYGESPRVGADLTLKADIEHHNFGSVTPDTPLGWANPDALGGLGVYDARRRNHLTRLYRIVDGMLYPVQRQKLFMITSNPAIAASDCLWYTVIEDPADGS
ncbi:MAG: succinylglutamate desuccinylase [Pseudohongiellaceae bacterium]